MSDCQVALIISFIYPGLGQIYRREILKGIIFMVICTSLILPLFFFSSPPFFLYLLGLSILLLMWLVGMVDAYMGEEVYMGRERWFIWQRLLSILTFAVIFAAVVVSVMLWTPDFTTVNERLANGRLTAGASVKSDPVVRDQGDTKAKDQFSNSEFFRVQVAAFRDLNGAEEVRRDLISRGYTVTIEQAISQGKAWHRVLVGRFHSQQDAISFMEKLSEREGFSDMVIHRWAAEIESSNSP